MKWSPWPTPAAAMRNFQVKLIPAKLEGFEIGNKLDEVKRRVMAVKIKWKGESKSGLLSCRRRRCGRQRDDFSSERIIINEGKPISIEWNDKFQNICCFKFVSKDQSFAPWNVKFNFLYGKETSYKSKLATIGKVSLNLAEMLGRKMESQIQRKIPVVLKLAGISKEATLLVLLRFTEIIDATGDLPGLVQNSTDCVPEEEYRFVDSDDSVPCDTEAATRSGSSPRSGTQLDEVNRRRLSLKSAVPKLEPSINKTVADESTAVDEWQTRELRSRDGRSKLKADVFFASFDQRSDKAAGESACTALVVVIAHWLQSNQHTRTTRSTFDDLIIEGSTEWRNLCDNEIYVNEFPNKHFDLETVLYADIRRVSVSRERSFVGFFGADKFRSLKGAMSFDEVWNEIADAEETGPRIYIVSWNDHFFVLKAETDAYYIIDTLGERLFEGCNQAYILKFDNSTSMHRIEEKAEVAESEEGIEEEICSGKECCREFIKRFLAAIPLKELEAEEEKGIVSYYSLHQRVQIEFNLICSLSSSQSSSPKSSLFSDEERIQLL